MTRIDSVVARPDRAGRYAVKFADGSILRLYRQTVEDFGLFPGCELGEETMARLREANGAMSAKMRAVRIVAASNVSRRDLEERLIRKGEDETQARAAVEWMEELNLVDDRETAAQIVARCAARGYGKARAKQMLFEKKIPKEYWDEALEDFPDQTEYILKFLSTKLTDPEDPRLVKKCVDALLRRGHSYGQVRSVLSTMGQEFPED